MTWSPLGCFTRTVCLYLLLVYIDIYYLIKLYLIKVFHGQSNKYKFKQRVLLLDTSALAAKLHASLLQHFLIEYIFID